MLGDAETRPSSYGRKCESYVGPSIFYEKFEIRYDLIVSDHLVGEYLSLLEIFREIKDDDHADEFTTDTNWQATDKNLRDGNMPYDVQGEAVRETDYESLQKDFKASEEPNMIEVSA